MVRTYRNDPRIDCNDQDIKDLKKVFSEKKIKLSRFSKELNTTADYLRKLMRCHHPFLTKFFERFVWTFRNVIEKDNPEFEKIVERIKNKNQHLKV